VGASDSVVTESTVGSVGTARRRITAVVRAGDTVVTESRVGSVDAARRRITAVVSAGDAVVTGCELMPAVLARTMRERLATGLSVRTEAAGALHHQLGVGWGWQDTSFCRPVRRSPRRRSYACCTAGGTQQSEVPGSAWVPISTGSVAPFCNRPRPRPCTPPWYHEADFHAPWVTRRAMGR